MAARSAAPADLGIGILFEVVRDAIVVGRADTGRIVAWNHAATDMFGYTTEQATGMLLSSLVPPELRDQHEAGIRRFAETGSANLVDADHTIEVPALHRSGHTLWVELRLSKLVPETQPGTYVLAVIRDVTDRRRAFDEVQRSNDALREFLSVASHDLRSPLAAISAAAEMLGLDRAERPDRTQLLVIIERQTRWLARLIDDFGTAAGVESGSVEPSPEDVEVDGLLRDAVGDAAKVSAGPGFRVRVDPTHLRRIVENLVQNAHKYGKPPVTVEVQRRDGGIAIAVSDAGAGVPVDERHRVFDKFWRGSGGRRAEHGTGLGLAIVQGLAEVNGGRAWYEHPEKSTFVVWFPEA